MKVQQFRNLAVKNFHDEELVVIFRALNLAIDAHSGQKRESGEDYIVHPIEVAAILIKHGLDYETIAASLLHDVIEDTKYTFDMIKDMFNETILDLIDGVTKIGKINFKTREDEQAENLRKMLLAMSKDIRVIIIKLADRLHNMRTLSFKSPERQIANAKETLEIFAPIAGRLGMGTIKCELEDLAMKYLYPDAYQDIVNKISATKETREKFVEQTSKILNEKLKELDIQGEVNGRQKHIYSIYLKMQRGKTFDQIYDLIALRIIVPTIKDCYEMLGVIHTMWKPLPGRFKDYIAMPKPNFYQSLHTTVISQYGAPFEIQIRTYKMHKVAEFGIAAHWKYKEKKGLDGEEDKLAWIREVIELQKDTKDSKELLETTKMDLYPDEVFIFTPEGDVKSLQYGATALDFAYKVHTEVGNTCVGVKIDSKIMPLNTVLQNGNIVEIITNKSSKGPSRDWLNYVVTQAAKNKIKAYFKKTQRQNNIKVGRDMLEREAKKRALNLKNLLTQNNIETICQKYSVHSIDDIYSMIGFGDLKPAQVMLRLTNIIDKEIKQQETLLVAADYQFDNSKNVNAHKERKKQGSGVIIKGFDDFLIRISRCCHPVPGDKIVGYITRGRGVCIHRADCKNVPSFEKERIIEAYWPLEQTGDSKYRSKIELVAYRVVGVLASITTIISQFNMQIVSMKINDLEKDKTHIVIGIEIKDLDDVKKVIDALQQTKNVIEVYRG